MKYVALACLLLTFTLAPSGALAAKRTRARVAAKCVGATPCRACSNCKYCKHCAKDGGKCGVCRNRKEAKGSWEEAAEATHQH
jgi:hypothetical protein